MGERGIGPKAFNWIDSEAVPPPYKELLVHDRDMTSTLAKYHGSAISLEVLNVVHEDDEYAREVILYAKENQVPVEYGAIDIELDNYREAEQAAIIEGSEPLGSILNKMEHPYHSRPSGFFSIAAPRICRESFDCSEGTELYGRYNQLFSDEEKVLASIIEILPRV